MISGKLPLCAAPWLGRAKPDYADFRPESGIIGYDFCPGLGRPVPNKAAVGPEAA